MGSNEMLSEGVIEVTFGRETGRLNCGSVFRILFSLV